MAAKKCKCGRKLILEMDKVRGRGVQCVRVESRGRTSPRKRGGKRGDTSDEVTMVWLGDTQITDAGLSEIKAALPNCTVKLSKTPMEDLEKMRKEAIAAIEELTKVAMFPYETWKRTWVMGLR